MDKGIKNKMTLETTKEFTSKTRMESNSKPCLEQLRIICTAKQRLSYRGRRIEKCIYTCGKQIGRRDDRR